MPSEQPRIGEGQDQTTKHNEAIQATGEGQLKNDLNMTWIINGLIWIDNLLPSSHILNHSCHLEFLIHHFHA